jgi:hypothetical protein
MIVIVTTISVYLAVYKGVPMDQPARDDEKPEQSRLLGWPARRVKTGRTQPAPSSASPPSNSRSDAR